MSRSTITRAAPLPVTQTAHTTVQWRTDMVVLAALAMLTLAALIFAYALPSRSRIDVGTSYAQPYSNNFFPPEANAQFDYAYSGANSEIRLPGIGRGTHTLYLRVSGWRPNEPQPARLNMFDDQRLLGSFSLADQKQVAPQTYRVALSTETGDVRLRLQSDTFSPGNGDSRNLGVLVDYVEIESHGVAPSSGQLLGGLLTALFGYLLLRLLALRPLPALLITLLGAGTLAWLLASQRLWWTVYTNRLWGLILGIALGTLLLQRFLPWLWRVTGVALTPAHTRWLLRILALAALVKIGGAMYPQMIVYDQRYHVPRTELLLNGQFMKLLEPSDVTALNVTVGLEGGHLPYSPLWYILVAPFGLLGADLGIASNALNGVIDVSRSIMIAYLAMRLFERPAAALWAAGVYHLFEMPYYLISWGNWPTQLGLWGGLLLICAVAATFEQLAERRALILMSAAALVSMLTYTVLGVMTFSMVGLLAVLELLRRTRPGFVRARTLVLSLVIAEAIAFVSYHVWYAPTIFAETLPAIIDGIRNPSRELHGMARPSPLGMIGINWDYTVNHISWPLMALLPVGAVLAFQQAKRGRLLLVAWLLTLVVYTIFDFAVAEVIFKHIFFTLPLFALFIGVLFGALWTQPRWYARLVPIGVSLYLASFIIERWWFYIMVKRH